MSKTIVHHERAASPKVAGHQSKPIPSVIKLGLDIHLACHVVVAQYDHALPKPPRRFDPGQVVPWVESLLKAGHQVYLVYEACGFGFGLQRALEKAGATCYVIAPGKLDERGKGVKTDALDAAALCPRLSRYVAGNTKELAVIRIPTEEEERQRHVPRQREALVRARTKLQAQGRGLLVNHGQAAPAHWWRGRTWRLLGECFPVWLLARLEVFRPVLLALDAQIAALTRELEAAAPPDLPAGLGPLTSVVLQREVCAWSRFKNRRQVSSYTGLCPGEYSSGEKRVPGSVTKHGNPRVRAARVECAWRLVRFQPQYPPVKKRLGVLAKGARATGAARKKALVAVARLWAVDLWRLATGRCTAAELGLQSRAAASNLPEVKVRGEQEEPVAVSTRATV
jgi:transposase